MVGRGGRAFSYLHWHISPVQKILGALGDKCLVVTLLMAGDNPSVLYFDLPTGQELVVARLIVNTNQPRQTVKLVLGDLTVHVSRSVNSNSVAENFSASQYPELIHRGIQLAEISLQVLRGQATGSVPSFSPDIPSASSAVTAEGLSHLDG